jgi:hypothetical protein
MFTWDGKERSALRPDSFLRTRKGISLTVVIVIGNGIVWGWALSQFMEAIR